MPENVTELLRAVCLALHDVLFRKTTGETSKSFAPNNGRMKTPIETQGTSIHSNESSTLETFKTLVMLKLIT